MELIKVLYLVVVCLCYWQIVLSQDEDEDKDNPNLPNDWAYCFEFTWVGPKYDNISTFNQTCDEYIDDGRDENIPCSPPIVVSYNGTPPDIDYLWKNHQASVLCRRSNGLVCAKYSYIFAGEVNNATYMCTKVLAMDEGPVKSGCYTQSYEGYDMELCVCESVPGLFKPCNSQNRVQSLWLLHLIIPLLLICFFRLKEKF